MESPDGHGSSTGEGRKGALLLLRGGRPREVKGTSERASALPSSNALRPDSNLNLGWYRPAEPEDSHQRSSRLDRRSGDEDSRQSDGQPAVLDDAAARLDLGAGSAPPGAADFPLGARRPRITSARGPEHDRPEVTRLGRAALAGLRCWVVALFASVAREIRQRRLLAAVGGLLLVVGSVAVVLLEQSGAPTRGPKPAIGAALNATQLRGTFLSDVASRLDELSQRKLETAVTPVHTRSTRHQRRPARGSHKTSAPDSRGSGGSTPVSHAVATTQSVSRGTSRAGGGSGTAPASEPPVQAAPVQQASVQHQASEQQAVHYQPPPQPAGPTGLGSQVGGNCSPKCS